MRIEIVTNTNFYLEVPEVKESMFILHSEPDIITVDSRIFVKGDYLAGDLPINIFFHLAEKIRGCEYYDIQRILLDSGLMVESELSESSVSVLDAIKSLFNIYYWTETLFYSQEDETLDQLNDILYDQFILDYKSIPGPQRDIYLLPNHLVLDRDNSTSINNLFSINLLDRLFIQHVRDFRTVFVPFYKPNIKKSQFLSLFPETGEHTFRLWQSILNSRDRKINDFLRGTA